MIDEFVSGTFARVCLCLHKPSSEYFALKILSFHEVIRLNQVEHVRNEKSILQARTASRTVLIMKIFSGSSPSILDSSAVEL